MTNNNPTSISFDEFDARREERIRRIREADANRADRERRKATDRIWQEIGGPWH